MSNELAGPTADHPVGNVGNRSPACRLALDGEFMKHRVRESRNQSHLGSGCPFACDFQDPLSVDLESRRYVVRSGAVKRLFSGSGPSSAKGAILRKIYRSLFLNWAVALLQLHRSGGFIRIASTVGFPGSEIGMDIGALRIHSGRSVQLFETSEGSVLAGVPKGRHRTSIRFYPLQSGTRIVQVARPT